INLPLGGRRFTRFEKRGKKASKLDRIFDKWIGVEGFHDVIKESWASTHLSHPSSNPDIILKDKLKKLRLDIKEWTSIRIKDQNKARDDLKNKLLEWGLKAEEGHISDYDVAKREEFKEARSNRPCFSSSRFRKLSDHKACFMESHMSVEEIKEAVVGCANSKAPGSDGFNFKFIKTFWDIIKFEFLECIKFFETSVRLTNGCNPSFIALIPKRKDPLGFGDYRPISLIGCVYKVISKILANRLARVIDTVISPNQAALIAGRQILDDVRRILDDMFLPKSDVPSRLVKQIPIKVNVLAWKISMDRLPTRVNLHRRGVQVSSISCPICCEALENLDHLLFCCDLAKDIARSICNWWGLVWKFGSVSIKFETGAGMSVLHFLVEYLVI
nr:transposon TX1 uncharacterized [Tanacetum cinerariifolium]